MPIDLITADPPAENADPWFGPRAAFDAQVKATANAAAAKADFLAEAAAAFAVIVTYGANPATPRPDVPNTVVWVGADDVVPTEMLESDLRLKYEGGSSFVGPFDMFTTPHRALSLRRLLASYTGPAIRVRRSSDDAEMNIGLDSDGGLDTSALLAFAGAGSAYVTTWYDQSGNVRNMTQATDAAQPRIVDSGVLDTVNSRPAVVFDGTDDFLTSAITGLYAAGATTVASVARVGGSASAVILEELADNSTATGNQGSYRIMRRVTTSDQWNWQLNAGNSQAYGLNAAGDTSWNNAQHQLFGIDTGSAISSWRDGVAAHASATATRGAAPALQRTSLGAAGGITPGGFAIAAFQELVLWGSDESADRAAISAAQKAFWGTP